VIELSFGVASGVGPGIDVLDVEPRVSRGRGCFGDFSALNFAPHWFEQAECRTDHPDTYSTHA